MTTTQTARPDDEVLAADEAVKVKGTVAGRSVRVLPLPDEGSVSRYVLTSAQNNTHVHEDAWLNLLALASHYDAEVIVGTYSYDKGSYGRKSVKRGTASASDGDDLWYDPQVVEHLVDEPVRLAPGLTWCGELNILPTAKNPLTSLEAYNGRSSNIIPHAKMALSSVACIDAEATKLNYTTGTVTQRNYIQKKTGQIAEQYHKYGGVLVEVMPDGSWFVRQLEATAEGLIRDCELLASGGEVTTGEVEALTPGDVHVAVLDPVVRETLWAPGGMVDQLRPRYQMLHDILDQRARNHHDRKDPLKTYRKWKAGKDSVADEVQDVADFLVDDADRPWCQMVIVPSNHNEALQKWLIEANIHDDPVNAEFYHRAWLALLDGEEDVFEWAIMTDGRCMELGEAKRLRFLRADESFVVAGVELGQHGHLGINGARGNHRSFTKLGRPATTGHEHSCAIYLDWYVSGTCTRLRLDYTRGPGSWTHSHVVQYPEGTRTMVTMWKGAWRAPPPPLP